MSSLIKKFIKNKGFTLVELIVAILIMGILFLMVTQLFGPMQKVFGSIERDVYADNAVQTTVDFVKGELATARNIRVYEGFPSGGAPLNYYSAAVDGFNSQVRAIYISHVGRVYWIPSDSITGGSIAIANYSTKFGSFMPDSPAIPLSSPPNSSLLYSDRSSGALFNNRDYLGGKFYAYQVVIPNAGGYIQVTAKVFDTYKNAFPPDSDTDNLRTVPMTEVIEVLNNKVNAFSDFISGSGDITLSSVPSGLLIVYTKIRG